MTETMINNSQTLHINCITNSDLSHTTPSIVPDNVSGFHQKHWDSTKVYLRPSAFNVCVNDMLLVFCDKTQIYADNVNEIHAYNMQTITVLDYILRSSFCSVQL